MSKDIKISVIVPAYNVEKWIKKCLDSILEQTYTNLEVIAIDDGSTDGTGNIIDMYAQKDNRIIAVHQENAGLVRTREKGISLSSGAYIGFVDADDYIVCDMYERLLKNAVKYEADISHCGMAFCYPDGKVENHYATGKLILQDNFNGQKDLLEGCFVEPSLCNKLYRSEILQESCLNPDILNNEDLLRNFVAFKRSKKNVYEDFCGYQYIQRVGSMSKNEEKRISSSKHVVAARKLIVDNASEKVRPYAMQSWLSAIVTIINLNTCCKEKNIKAYCKQCREILKKERSNLHYLIPRQQTAARLIIVAPALHRIIYRIYQGRGRK